MCTLFYFWRTRPSAFWPNTFYVHLREVFKTSGRRLGDDGQAGLGNPGGLWKGGLDICYSTSIQLGHCQFELCLFIP